MEVRVYERTKIDLLLITYASSIILSIL